MIFLVKIVWNYIAMMILKENLNIFKTNFNITNKNYRMHKTIKALKKINIQTKMKINMIRINTGINILINNSMKVMIVKITNFRKNNINCKSK
jgi:hypothetical protein